VNEYDKECLISLLELEIQFFNLLKIIIYTSLKYKDVAKRVSRGLDTGKYYGIIFKNTVIIVRRCLTCEDYDLCEECYAQQVENKRHSKDHKMQAILGTAHFGHVVSII
jgi:hypothetical protein